MDNTSAIMQELERMGNDTTKRIFQNHGAPEPLFGVKVGDLKTIVKRIKKDHDLALSLYATGNSDAMYLAGLLADEKKITPADLRRWAEQATWHMQSEYTVPWVAAESPHGWTLGLEWIESEKESIAAGGWNTLAGWVSLQPDAALDLPLLEKLLDRIAVGIHQAPNRVRYAMNGFLIAVGSAVEPLTEKALAVADQIGKVSVEMGGTACKVPGARAYIEKVKAAGKWGAKRKMVRC